MKYTDKNTNIACISTNFTICQIALVLLPENVRSSEVCFRKEFAIHYLRVQSSVEYISREFHLLSVIIKRCHLTELYVCWASPKLNVRFLPNCWEVSIDSVSVNPVNVAINLIDTCYRMKEY